MGASATADQVDEVVVRLEEAGANAHVTPGKEATVIGAIGERDLLAALPLEGYPGVEQVLPILKPYKLVSRELSPEPTVVSARGRRIGDGYFGLIAGPVLGRVPRADPRGGARRAGGRSDHAPRRRVQAALLALRLPGPRPGGPRHPRRGARGDRAPDRHRAHGRAARRGGRRGRGRDPDRRPEHAELHAPLGGRPVGEAGAPEARRRRRPSRSS